MRGFARESTRRILLALLITLPCLAASGQAQETHEVVILHDTHFHGHFGAPDEANIARYAALVRDLRGERDNVLFVGNGDDLAPSLLSSLYGGAHMVDALNAMGLDFNTFGNHEFDFGPDNLLEQLARSEFQWVSANILDSRTGDVFGAEQGAERYVIHTMPSGLRVGVTGFAPPDTPEVTTLGEHAVVVDLAEAAREVVAMMEADGADIVLALSHLCWPDAEELAAEVEGIDVIVGDHCSTVLEEPKVIGDTIVSRVGDEFDHLGELTLRVQGSEVVDWDFTLHTLHGPDEEVAAIVEEYETRLDEALGETVGETSVPLEVTRAAVRSEETNAGNFIADVMRDWAEADVALQNGGSIRSDKVIPAGPLTRRDVLEMLPFENHVVKLEIPGSVLEEVLELSVSTVEEGHGRFLQVSGLSFAYDPAAPPFERVREVLVGGEPLDPQATYSLATNSFIAEGGDGYAMLADLPLLVDAHAGPLHSVLVEEAIRERSPIGPVEEQRIRTVTP